MGACASARAPDGLGRKGVGERRSHMSETQPSAGITEPIEVSREPEFTLGSLQVRPPLLEVSTTGLRQTLQPRVMQVLIALARRTGEVVSRDELVATCW